MAGLNDTDIRLNDEWQLTQASTGDAPVCSGLGWTVFFKISASKQLHSRENFFTIQSGGGDFLNFFRRRMMISPVSRSASGLKISSGVEKRSEPKQLP